MTGKFQEYDEDFSYWDESTIGDTPEIPIENISVPITYYFAKEDTLCKP